MSGNLKYLSIINNTASTVLLKCTRAYSTQNSKYTSVTYKLGEIKPRNLIFLNPANWSICPKQDVKKYNKTKQKFIFKD